MIKRSVIFIVFLVLTISCKSSKTSSATITSLSAKKIIKRNNEVKFDKESLKANLSIKYSGKAELPNLKASLRIVKDSIIWISVSKFSIPLAKVIITQNQVQFYEKLSKTYFIGDFKLIREWIGVELDFSKVQNLFLGEPLLNLNKDKYEVDIQENEYILEPKKENPIYDILFWIDPGNFKLSREELKNPNKEQSLSIEYKDYINLENSLFPKGFLVRADDGENETKIEINYRNVVFNTTLRFPFKIPNGYKEIELR